ncbi:AAA family ATPase [Stenotrophomonas maltophilia]|uniref:ParA family protein n=1 Tax=Stenotrophomonas sp. ASS1 TaxID=2282124 RepID=UPI001051AE2B|nr:AAA family ATPase [Stenotrophomonas sp. ASS1]QBL39327.1 ParA family protein [Stenotrophomonas sp. ASS1]
MKSIVFFNNKGGVGKTTLACNVVAYLNSELGKRVLLVDADPQCNATQAVLDDATCQEIYADGSPIKSLYAYLRPIEHGESQIDRQIVPILAKDNRFQTDIIPGHPRLSIIEDQLSDAWTGLQARQIGGYRVTNWCKQLLGEVADKYDYVVFDVGPSLGALNRSVILACDYIVTPFGCDIFSLLGIRNISTWIASWKQQYDRSIEDGMTDHPGVLEGYPIVVDTTKHFRFIGYSVQQYVTRTFKSGRRPVKSYDQIMREIPGTVDDAMTFLRAHKLESKDLELGHIPNLFSLVPMAQSAKSPIHKLNSADGVIGSQYAQVESYTRTLSAVCLKLLNNLHKANQ